MAFSFVQITDHHLRESEALLTRGYSTAYAFRAVMRHIAQHAASRADFIVTTGDLVNFGTDAEVVRSRATGRFGGLSGGPLCHAGSVVT
ncbi:MAG: metallophosphoesterase [Anaerolineae bacterium]|nr:metallophosphoesterase [Anaerolineae bacterium]